MKFASSFLFLVCCLLAGTGIIVLANSLNPAPVVLAGGRPMQDSGSNSSSSASLTGAWQLTWTPESGGQRQASMQIKQDGTKLSGKFQGERGSASLSGNLDGSQVSFSVKVRKREFSFSGKVDGDQMSGTTGRGASWTATRQQQQE